MQGGAASGIMNLQLWVLHQDILVETLIFTGAADTTMSSKTPSGKIREGTGQLPSVSLPSWNCDGKRYLEPRD